MPIHKPLVLAIDDDPTCLEIIEQSLHKNFEVITAQNGKDALIQLWHHPEVQVIILDWMMPVMDGMDFLFRLRQNQQFDRVPVIFQTARTSPEHIATGLAAGVFYYLQKPYSSSILHALVEAALRDAAQWQALQSHCATLSKKSHDLCRAVIRMRNSEFGFRTPAQARRVASLLASCFPDPSQVVIGILELMMNAVEHGNLGFSFSEKR